uniref:Uncharacterized protein n=1 Tax=Arundo donax TaxID=35708 RepID=A0A0A9FF81_ARUDO
MALSKTQLKFPAPTNPKSYRPWFNRTANLSMVQQNSKSITHRSVQKQQIWFYGS